MFGKSITLFRLFGFSVRIDVSWLVILVLVVGSLAGGIFPMWYPGLHWGLYLGMGLAAALGLFISIVFHELSHSLVARRYGLPIKGITLFIFGGVAEMTDEPPTAKAEFAMAIAGPIASMIIGGLSLGLHFVAVHQGWSQTVYGVFLWVGMINLILAGFNLIPGFPLDGGRVLRSVMWQLKGDLRAATRTASRVGGAFGLGLIAFGVLRLLLLDPIGGLWFVLIGMFLRSAAKQGYQQVLIRQALQGEPVRRFMTADPVVVPPETYLEDVVENYVYTHHFKMFPVVDARGQLCGCITTRQIKDVPRDQWSQRTAGELAEDCSEENTVGPDDDAMHALTAMSRSQTSRMMVVQDGRLVGILALKDLMGFLSLKLELESGAPPSPRPGEPSE